MLGYSEKINQTRLHFCSPNPILAQEEKKLLKQSHDRPNPAIPVLIFQPKSLLHDLL